jgi:hypothetical protein
MANRWAITNGNWSNTATWNTGSILGIPTASDDAYSNNFTVTVDQNITVLSLRNGASAPIAAGGTFALANGVTVTVTAANGLLASVANLTRITGSDSATIIGNFGSGNIAGPALLISQSANVTVTGSITGGGNTGVTAINHASSGTLNISGSIQGGSGTNTHGITLSSSGSINMVGTITGGSSTTAHGINSTSTGIVTVTGSITGGTSTGAGINATSTGTILVSGSVQSGIGTSGVISSGASIMQIIGPVSSSIVAPGVQSTSTTAINTFTGPFLNRNNRNAVFAPNIQLISGSTPTWTFDTETYGEQRTLYTADYPGNFPSSADVRDGVVFGDINQFTGTVAIPSTGSVLKGVPVDNTTGSASFDTQSVWGINTNNLTVTGSLGARLRNVATVATDGAAIASKGTL